MPAKKAARKSVKRYRRNQSVRRTTRTAITGARRAIRSGDEEVAEPAIRHAISLLDKAVKKGRPSQEQRLPPQVPPGCQTEPDAELTGYPPIWFLSVRGISPRTVF